MMFRFGCAAFLCCLFSALSVAGAQTQPRLVVVVSFDQFRGDMPENFRRFFGEKGFTRIEREGAQFTGCMFEHASNITGPGHAALLTGAYPYKSGIVGNDFCNVESAQCVYCAADDSGTPSAAQLLVPTVGDILRTRSPRSKVIGVALKDRAAILMAGAQASTCVWFDTDRYVWTSSTAFPAVSWLAELNRNVNVRSHSGKQWNLRIPERLEPAFDSVSAEGMFPGGSNVFPHVIPALTDTTAQLRRQQALAVMLSPFSLSMIFDAAWMAVQKERLGVDNAPDILCVGVSTTDYVGHQFGPDSREVQELFVHADELLGTFIDRLDTKIGRRNYVLVITSDHGVAPVPEVIRGLAHQQEATIDAGRIRRDADVIQPLDSVLRAWFGAPQGKSYVRKMKEPSIYLDLPASGGVDPETVAAIAMEFLNGVEGIGFVATRELLRAGQCPPGTDESECRRVLRSYHPERSGNIVLYPKRYWIMSGNVATHGTPHDYDRHVPLMLFGGNISPGTYANTVEPVDIAPTVAKMLGISMPVMDGRELPLR